MSIGTRIYAELRGDRSIWAIMAVLSIFSILVVYSSTGTLAYREMAGNTETLLIKHFMIVVGGLFLAYLAHLVHYLRYSKAAPFLLLLSVPLLVYTIAFGADINDARRWITVPFVGITFQTSDFAKLALILYVARAISSKQDYIKDFNSAFLPIIVPVLIICGLIAPADLSSAILLFFTCVCMMFVGRVALQYIVLLLLLGIVVFAMLVLLGEFFPEIIRSETWVSRVRDFVDKPDGGYQVQQAKIAMANGEWFGLGPGNSIQRNYLPSPYSDFIYAIVVEEYGIFIGILLILLYVLLFFRATRLVTKSPKAFGAMLAMGLSISLVLQAFINIAVSVHLVPVTGVTLPMISMGGTSILFTCISFGMILSVSKYIESVS
ncbi:MAG: FtsW/RodA/SpoVE family cell cycle protein [Lewinellaceae bacterium]|nr:FtsW/RodA/SpoVE family cell cycle protein [Phaeodactylibacter sp.]MCB9035737.1 FtsW/RodA/SpoVE family cell cycle protein [Lewinellaceae bacterium]